MPDPLGGVFDNARPIELQLSAAGNAAVGLPADTGPVSVRDAILRDGFLQVDHAVSGGRNRYLLPPAAVLFARQNFPDTPPSPEPGQG